MSRKKTGRSQEEMATTLSYMVFDFKHGWMCGPGHPRTPGYWNTGEIASWSREALIAKRGAAGRPDGA